MNTVKSHLLTMIIAGSLVGVATTTVTAGGGSPLDAIWVELNALGETTTDLGNTTTDLQTQINDLAAAPVPSAVALSKSNVYYRSDMVSVEPGAIGIAEAACDDGDDFLLHGGFWGGGAMHVLSSFSRLSHTSQPAYWQVAARNDASITDNVQATVVCYTIDAP